MRIAALGSVNPPTPRPVTTRQTGMFVSHVLMQAAFIAPGVWLAGGRGWRLLLGSLGGSASLTVLTWLWAQAEGYTMMPMHGANQPLPQAQPTPASAPASYIEA